MALTDIPLKAGVFTDATPRGVGKEGYWKSSDKVRFFDGLPAKIGGWTRGVSDPQFEGFARGSCDWRTPRAEVFIAFGTELKLYAWRGGSYSNITPLDESGQLTDPFSTTDTLTTVTVNDPSHGRLVGDRVFFTGASAVGGITISGEYSVVSITSPSAYTITHTSPATSTAGPGGGTVNYEYEIHIGATNSIAGLGWGAGAWGLSLWGTPRSTTSFLTAARTWTIEQWGEDVICNPAQGGIYIWDSSTGVTVRATRITQAPTTAKAILVSPEDRHLIALGAHDGVSDNPMLVRWCDQENYTDWTPSVTNTAGAKQLDMGNSIICGAKVRGEHLIFTDSSLYSMVFVGPPDTFAFRTLGDNGGLVGPMAVHVFEGVAYWMGDRGFFMYDGVTKVLNCTVESAVFDDFNRTERAKVWSGVNREFREAWWLFPSSSSSECDKYAIFNLKDQSWSYGTLDRTMLVGDSEVISGAYGFGTDNYIYTHETGADDYLQPMEAFIESGDVEIDAAGGQIAHLGKFIPDIVDFAGGVGVTVKGKKYPQDSAYYTSGPHTVTTTTPFVNPRIRARQIAIRISSDGLGDTWRLGSIRVDLVPHGGR